MADNRPVRIGDTVRIIAERKGFAVGAICTVTRIDVLNNTLRVENKKKYPCIVKIEDVEIVSSPEWQLTLI